MRYNAEGFAMFFSEFARVDRLLTTLSNPKGTAAEVSNCDAITFFLNMHYSLLHVPMSCSRSLLS